MRPSDPSCDVGSHAGPSHQPEEMRNLVVAVNVNSHHIGLSVAPISLVVEALDSPKCPPGRARTRLVVIRSKLQEPPNRGPPADATTHCPSRYPRDTEAQSDRSEKCQGSAGLNLGIS